MADPTREELLAIGASDAACYLYPGEGDQSLRAAFIAGAVLAASAKDAEHALVEEPGERVDWRAGVQEAIELLMETRQGSPSRSAGHNARLALQRLLAASPQPPAADQSAAGEVERLQGELKRFRETDAYVVGFNDGFAEANNA